MAAEQLNPASRLGHIAWATACLAIAALAVALFALGVPVYYAQLQTVCAEPPCYSSVPPEAVRALEAAGPSLRSVAGYQVGLIVANALAHIAVAAVIFWRRPADRMAWFTGLTLVTFGTLGVQDSELVHGLAAGAYPLGRALIYAISIVGASSINLLFFVFPDGRFVPRGWRWPAAALLAWQMLVVLFPGAWFDPDAWPFLPNLLYWSLLFAALIAAQVYRYQHVSTALQRQQTKWAVLGFSLALGGALAAYSFTTLAPDLDPRWAPLALAQGTIYYLFLPIIPLFIGVAILRSRLWDIDVIIRRTLVYSTLTALLALVYFGSVVALQALLRGLTGAESPLVIVLSTLIIAALFVPLRSRVQRAIDRRFYRRKYDAARTLAAFAASARDETDLKRLSEQLQQTVQDAMEPAHVGLWLEPARDPLPRSDAK